MFPKWARNCKMIANVITFGALFLRTPESRTTISDFNHKRSMQSHKLVSWEVFSSQTKSK